MSMDGKAPNQAELPVTLICDNCGSGVKTPFCPWCGASCGHKLKKGHYLDELIQYLKRKSKYRECHPDVLIWVKLIAELNHKNQETLDEPATDLTKTGK